MKITFDIPDNTIGAVLVFVAEAESGYLGMGTLEARSDELYDGAVRVWAPPKSDDVQAHIGVLHEFMAKQTEEIARLERENAELRAKLEFEG